MHEEVFWDSLLQLAGWPACEDAVKKLIYDLSKGVVVGFRIPETLLHIAKTTIPTPDGQVLRLILYYVLLDQGPEGDVAVMYFVEEYDPDARLQPRLERIKRVQSHH